MQTLSLGEFATLVNQASTLAPLSEQVMDLSVHLAMMEANYKDFEAFADKVSTATGRIKIAGYSDHEFFWLVIDGEQKRIYTEVDPHPFRVEYPFNGKGRLPPGPINPWNGSLVPFDLRFA